MVSRTLECRKRQERKVELLSNIRFEQEQLVLYII